jgi:NhaA family Na+:H+ antiporter
VVEPSPRGRYQRSQARYFRIVSTAPTDDHLHESEAASWRLIRPLADFLQRQASAGVLLVLAAAVALVWANSPWFATYATFWSNEVSLAIGEHGLTLTLRELINDALMTLFFFVAGMEIKREVTAGELRHIRHAALPIIGAVGGMVVPAAIYALINLGSEGARGWGIPMATDIAIVMGVIALLASRVPSWLKLFLLALAIVDDIGAILVIAVFYSESVSLGWLLVAAAAVAVARWMRPRVPAISAYVVLGTVCWLALHEAHVHPTLAGVAFGLLAPITPRRNTGLVDAEELLLHPTAEVAAHLVAQARSSVSVVEWLIHRLSPVTAFVIAPLFALANAGVHVPLNEVSAALGSPVTWGVVAGLVVGKVLGIFGAVMLAVRLRIGTLPVGVTPRYLLGASALGGIGFTVSLFVSQLAFGDTELGRDARLGVLIASAVAALIGACLLVPGKPPSASAHTDIVTIRDHTATHDSESPDRESADSESAGRESPGRISPLGAGRSRDAGPRNAGPHNAGPHNAGPHNAGLIPRVAPSIPEPRRDQP